MICRGTATSRSSLPWLCCSLARALDQESCAILKRSSDPWCEIAILSQPPLLLFLTGFTLSATFQRIVVVPCLAYLLAKHTTTNVPLEKVTWLSGLVVGRADLTAFEIVGVGVDCRISACHHTFAKARRRQGKIHICTASIHHVSQLPEGNYSPAKEIRRRKNTHARYGVRSPEGKETWDLGYMYLRLLQEIDEERVHSYMQQILRSVEILV